MKSKYILKSILLALIAVAGFSSCSTDPDFYSQAVPATFYTNKEAVYQRYSRPFTHWRWMAAHNESYWCLQELGTDEFVTPARGSDWYNGGEYVKFHHHEYSSSMSGHVEQGWRLSQMGVALAWDAAEDLEQVDFEKLGFKPGEKESLINQLKGLVAWFDLKCLDLFGGITLYSSTKEGLKGRASDVETFNYIDSLLTAILPTLPVKQELGGMETGEVHAAAAATMKAELYFNAKPYIGKEMYKECAQICQDIIDGKYGKYALDEDWTKTWGFDNETSTEIIWSVPSEHTSETDGTHWAFSMPYNYRNYLGGIENSGANNGTCLQPSLDPTGKEYTFRLGRPYAKFNDKDVRKQNYVYEGSGKYRGMFVVGKLVNPENPEWTCTGSREYSGQVINEVDQIAYFNRVHNDKYKKANGDYEYNTVADLPSTVLTAEENSGVRLLKYCPRPTKNDYDRYYGKPDSPIMRLAEIYYMLAECKMRLGDKDGAAKLINTVRRRYFKDGIDPDPVTAANLDKYRMLDEWMIEFLGEYRRRTDLVRWDAYTTEDWWDHKADGSDKEYLNRWPIHYSVIGSNNLINQNPGYGGE